jgi:hypothetical protein
MNVSNDDKVKELDRRITKLSSSDTLPNKKIEKPNKSALLELAKKIRESVEDYSVETTVYPKPSK